MILCSVELIRFCSPFVHYQTTEPNVPSGALHGGTHIDTMVYQVPLVDSFNFSMQVPVQVLEPGAFTIVVGAFFVYPSDTNASTFYAVQLANVASDYPVISFWHVHVSRPSRLAAYVLIASSGAVLLFLLLVTIRHRQSQVLKLTQGNMLIAMMVTALIATVSAITFEPKSNLYCNLQGPLIIMPLHFLFAILLGRLWRIQAVVSPLLLLTLERKDTWSDNFVQWLRKVTELKHPPSKKSRDNYDQSQHHQHDLSISAVDSIRSSWIHSFLKRNSTNISSQRQPPPSTRRSFRRKVTEGQLVRVVAIFCFPQVVVQVLYLIFAREQLMNGICPTDFLASPTDGFGGVFLLLLVLLLLAMARSSKDLPSLFNENEALWDVSLVSLVLLGVSFVVIVITHAPTTNPDIRYIVSTLVVVAITTNTCTKILLPKLRKIWQNEKVVVTKLISDHNRQERSPLVIIPESPDDEPEEDGENNQRRESKRRRGDSIAPPIPSHVLPQNRNNNNVANIPEGDPTDQDGTDSDESSVMLMSPLETDLLETSLNRAQSEGEGSNTMTDTQSIDLQHPDHRVVDSVPYRFNPSGSAGSFRRNSQGLPSRTSFLSTSSNNIPENSSLPLMLTSQFPSLTGSAPESEPSPSGHQNVRSSRLHHRRVAHASIVRNRSRFSINRPGGRSSLFSHNGNGEVTQSARASGGSIRLSVFRQKRQSNQLLDIGYNPKKRNQMIHISSDNPEPPPRRLLLRMIDVNHTLGLVNRAVLSGDQVTQESWEFLREAVVALGRVFEEEVVFDWEPTSEEPYMLNVPILAATQSEPVSSGNPYVNSQHYSRPTILSTTQSAPFPRDGFYPPYISSQQHQRQPITPSFAPSLGSSGAAAADLGSDSSAGPSSNAEGRMPFSKDNSAGRILNGLLQHLPRPLSRRGLLRRHASLHSSLDKRQHASASPNESNPIESIKRPRSLQTASSISHLAASVIPEDVNEHKEEDDEEDGEDEEANEKVQDDLLRRFPSRPRPPRVLPRSGHSFPRSRYRSSDGPMSSLTTIQSVLSESLTSDDSGLASSRMFQTSEHGSSTLFPSASTSMIDATAVHADIEKDPPRAIDSLVLPPSPVARRALRMQVSSLSDESEKDEVDDDDDDDGKQEAAENQLNDDGFDRRMD
jgi:hypothetical protein